MRGAAKVGVAGAAIAWAAPRFDSVAYAADNTGSPEETTTTGESTTTIGGSGEPTCRIDPEVLNLSRLPFRLRVIGSRWAPSSKVNVTLVGVRLLGVVTTNPSGAFDTRVEIPASVPAGVYQVEFSGYLPNGERFRCFRRFEISPNGGAQGGTSTTGSSATTSGGNSNSGTGNASGNGASGSGSGNLPETGSDSRTLLLVGAGAVVAGRSLYALRHRIANATADGEAHIR
jgi:LPXTG-motif cell wall-anchored protein